MAKGTMTLPEIIAQLRREPEWKGYTVHDMLLCCAEPWPNYDLVAREHNATRRKLLAALDALEITCQKLDDIAKEWVMQDYSCGNVISYRHVDDARDLLAGITARLAKALEDNK